MELRELDNLFLMNTSSTHLHFMTFRQRWEVFMACLLGYPTLPNGGRLKDHPFNDQAADYINQFQNILNRKSRVKKEKKYDKISSRMYARYLILMIVTRYHFALQLNDLQSKVNHHADDQSVPSENGHLRDIEDDFFEKALQCVLEDLLFQYTQSCGSSGEDRLLQEGVRAKIEHIFNLQHPDNFRERVINHPYLSITRDTKHGNAPSKKMVALKTLFAQIITCTERALVISSNGSLAVDKTIETQLKRVQFWIISIKTKKVQTLLSECKSHFIRRGASIWCTHVLSLIRDLFLKAPPNSVLYPYQQQEIFLLLDSNAVLKLGLCYLDSAYQIPNVELINSFKRTLTTQLKEQLTHILSSAEDRFFDEIYPGLRSWRKAAQEDPKKYNITSIIPELRVDIEPVSLLQFCSERGTYKQNHQSAKVNCSFQRPTRQKVPADLECAGRIGEYSFTEQRFSTPINYTKSVGRRKKTYQRYGWSSIVFALVGKSYRLSVDLSIVNQINKDLRDHSSNHQVIMARNWETRLNYRLDESDRHYREVVLVKIDGDRLGKMFVTSTRLEQCQISQSLEHYVQDLYTKTCKNISRVISKSPSTSIVPIDLIYFGGDDLEFMIRAHEYETFIQELIDELNEPDKRIPKINQIKYSLAAVKFTYNADDSTHLTMASDDLNLLLKQYVKKPKWVEQRPKISEGEVIENTRFESTETELKGKYTVSTIYSEASEKKRLYGVLFDLMPPTTD